MISSRDSLDGHNFAQVDSSGQTGASLPFWNLALNKFEIVSTEVFGGSTI